MSSTPAWEGLPERLKRAIAGGLPGVEAQLRLAPRPRRGWRPGEIPEDSRRGAALALLFPLRGEIGIVLTVRDRRLPYHPGQVSLPGGAVEPEEDCESAALREAEEEVGVPRESVELLGRLSPLHIPASRFALHPIVGAMATRPRFVAQPGEVDRVIEARLSALAAPEAVRIERRVRPEGVYRVPYLEVAGAKVWGATAMVLSELLTLVGIAPDPWRDDQRDP